MRKQINRNTYESNPEKDIFIFDVDGTLTPPNKPMDMQFMRWFEQWMLKKCLSVVLCTSNTHESISSRLGRKIIEQSHFTFTCGGNEVWANRKKTVLNDWRPQIELIQCLDQIVHESGFKTRSGPNIEYRTGMVSFSIPGKLVNDTDREKYKVWDYQTKERNKIVRTIKEKFPNLSVVRSGDTSVDISNTDKSQVIKYFANNKRVWIFGNEFIDGNDKPILAMLDKNGPTQYNIKNVSNDQETFSLLRKLVL